MSLEHDENTKRLINDVKLRKIDTPILTTFLQAPIFVPAKKGVSKGVDNFREIVVKRSKSETITITGPVLDMNKDFPIWATVLKEVELRETNKVTLHDGDLLKKIGYSANNINVSNKRRIEARIDSMMKVNVKIELKNPETDEDCTYFINVFSSAKWDRAKKIFVFTVNDDLFTAYTQIRWKAVDLDYYQRIKTDYAKALFCYYESHSDFIIPINRERLIERLGLGTYSRKNNANRKIKEAHDHLKEIGFLKDYDISIKNEGDTFYHVSKVPKQERLLLIA
jgi:hypothetical protein